MKLKIDLENISDFVSDDQMEAFIQPLSEADDMIRRGTGKGHDYLGWLNLPDKYDKAEFSRIMSAAAKIKADSQVLIVIGIGGSYLGARAVIEALHSQNYNIMPKNTPEIYFVGNNLSPDYINSIVKLLGDRDFSINIISKSGTTTEPAVAFRIFRSILEKKCGKENAAKRIYVTTGRVSGALKRMADASGYECFIIPDDIGGRYSVLTPAGLLPICVSGADITKLMEGAAGMMDICRTRGLENPAWAYAGARNILYRGGKNIEILGCYEPFFRFMGEWWKQLFGESEGKDGRGIFPAYVDLTADLHSMGQYIQDGERIIFETVIDIESSRTDMSVCLDEDDLDELNYLAGKSLNYINHQVMRATALAHVDGMVPNIAVRIPQMDEAGIGSLIYFFEYSCGLSGYLLDVNPFNQPGVEAYKKNMHALLGKPGYEKLREKLISRL